MNRQHVLVTESTMFRHLLFATTIGTLALVASATRAACHYSVTVILAPEPCPFSGPPPTYGTGLSDTGEVVGWYQDCDVSGADHAFRWQAECGFEDVEIDWEGVLGNQLYDVNASGAVTGAVNYRSPGPHYVSYLVPAGGEVIEIPLPEGAISTEAQAINELAHVAGWWAIDGGDRGFVWRDGEFIDFGKSMPAFFRVRPFDINDAGQVVGWRTEKDLSERSGFVWHDGKSIDLGPIPSGVSSEASAINEYGVIVGTGRLRLDSPDLRGFVWEDGAYTHLIEPLRDAVSMFASDINDRGVVVGGIACPQGCENHAVIYVNGTLYKLEDLLVEPFGGELDVARKVNDGGQILCDGGLHFTADSPAILLTPVDSKASDLTGDCATSTADLEVLLSRWNTADRIADLNGDGTVGFFDLTVLLINWG